MSKQNAPIAGLPHCDVCGRVKKDGRHPECRKFDDVRNELRSDFASILILRKEASCAAFDAYNDAKTVRDMIDLLGNLIGDRDAWMHDSALTLLRIQRCAFLKIVPNHEYWVHPPASADDEID